MQNDTSARNIYVLSLVNLKHQKVLKDYGCSLEINKNEIIFKCSGKFQDFTEDNIEDGKPYTQDFETIIYAEHISLITLKKVETGIYACEVDCVGIEGPMIIYYYDKEKARELFEMFKKLKREYGIKY